MQHSTRLTRLFHEYRSTLLFLGLMLVFRSACADWMTVPTGSMNPTILEGDRIFVNKHVYGWRVPFTTARFTSGSDPQRGEIAVFYSPKDNVRLVKRVIGIPGDTIEMRGEVLLINGQAQQYVRDAQAHELLDSVQQLAPLFFTEQLPCADTTCDHIVMFLPQRMAMRSFGPVVIPIGKYLMLGDNRDNSTDSRYIGLVPRNSIVGRASEVVVSLNPEHWYLPRAGRYWQPLS